MSHKHGIAKFGQTNVLGIIFILVLAISGVYATDAAAAAQVETKRIELVSGKSVVLRTEFAVKRISIANPEIADFNLLSPTEIYLTGKAAGTTNLTMWQDGRLTAVYDLVVTYDVSRLKHQMQEVLPAEKDLRIAAANDALTLSGKVTNAAALNQTSIVRQLRQSCAATISVPGPSSRSRLSGGMHTKCRSSTLARANNPAPVAGEPNRS